MRNIDFAMYYEALGLEPGASDKEITRAKRACNELYHADRLGHMSPAAQEIAAEKVKAVNEAAQALLNPSFRSARDRWITEWRGRGSSSPPPRQEPPPQAPVPQPSVEVNATKVPAPSRLARAMMASLGIGLGAVVGATAFLMQEGRRIEVVTPSPRTVPDVIIPNPLGSITPERPRPRLKSVLDSMIIMRGDGGWTAQIPTGGSSWQASFIPESDNIMYRVRTNGTTEYVLNSEPGFRRISEEVQSYEFSSLTGQPVRVRYTRWPRNAPRGSVIHTRMLDLPGNGEWSQRVWLGPFGFRWDVNRAVAYEVRDDEGRISRVPPAVQSVAFGRTPVWVRFRSIDSLPLALTFAYTVP